MKKRVLSVVATALITLGAVIAPTAPGMAANSVSGHGCTTNLIATTGSLGQPVRYAITSCGAITGGVSEVQGKIYCTAAFDQVTGWVKSHKQRSSSSCTFGATGVGQTAR